MVFGRNDKREELKINECGLGDLRWKVKKCELVSLCPWVTLGLGAIPSYLYEREKCMRRLRLPGKDASVENERLKISFSAT
jgi:hypothetical protein